MRGHLVEILKGYAGDTSQNAAEYLRQRLAKAVGRRVIAETTAVSTTLKVSAPWLFRDIVRHSLNPAQIEADVNAAGIDCVCVQTGNGCRLHLDKPANPRAAQIEIAII